jgi:hypothetical protein
LTSQIEKFKKSSRPIDDDWSDEDEEDCQADKYDLPDPMLALRRGERTAAFSSVVQMFTSALDELERQVKEAQETVKQLRRMAPASIHDAAGVQLASLSKDFEDVLATGVIDKSVPVRVRVPSDLCSSMMASFFQVAQADVCLSAICDIAKAAKRLDKKCGMLKVRMIPVFLSIPLTQCATGAVGINCDRCRTACQGDSSGNEYTMCFETHKIIRERAGWRACCKTMMIAQKTKKTAHSREWLCAL